MGTNAVVAVISYTVRFCFPEAIFRTFYELFYFQGYDMEDAMIINKSSLERGFAHGSIYKCDLIELQVRFNLLFLIFSLLLLC